MNNEFHIFYQSCKLHKISVFNKQKKEKKEIARIDKTRASQK